MGSEGGQVRRCYDFSFSGFCDAGSALFGAAFGAIFISISIFIFERDVSLTSMSRFDCEQDEMVFWDAIVRQLLMRTRARTHSMKRWPGYGLFRIRIYDTLARAP
jgi:hypothetical protein